MGGRGTLGHSFSYKNKDEIISALRQHGIVLNNGGLITNRNKALISTITEQLLDLQKKHGVKFDSILLESIKDASSPNGSVLSTRHFVGGKSQLVIRVATHKKTLREMNSLVKNSNKKNNVATKNVKELVMHEYGHVLHKKLKYSNPKMYNKLNKDLDALNKTKGKKVKVSNYANNHYKSKGNHQESIAESMVYTLSGRKSRNGQDTINTVKRAFQKSGILSKPKPKVVKPTGSKVKGATKSELDYIFS